VAKRGRFMGARRSSSRERRVFDEGCAVSFVLRRGRDARRDCRWKAPWVGKAHAFHEAPRNRSWRPPSKRPGFEEKRNQAHGTEEATRVSEAVGNRVHTAEENAIA